MLKGRLLIRLIGIVATLVICLVSATPALDVDPPESMGIEDAMVFRDLVEDDDMLVVFHFNLVYTAGYPEDASARESIIFRLFSDNGTLLASALPYPFYLFETNGYGHGIASFYFSKDDAPEWEGDHVINILGLPAYFDPVPTPEDYTLVLGDYSVAVGQYNSQLDLYAFIIALSNELKDVFPLVALTVSTDTGIVLSVYGEPYFRGAILGIQTMCPQLFFVQVVTPDLMPTQEYDLSVGTTYAERLSGSDLKRGFDRVGSALGGISGNFVIGILSFVGGMALSVWSLRKGWGMEPGLILNVGIFALLAIMAGDTFFTLFMILGLGASMGIMYIFGYKRA